MIVVERQFLDYPSFPWGKDICVDARSDELVISTVVLAGEENRKTARDPLRDYRRAVSSFGPQKREGKNSPHIQFANAGSDHELIRFVQRYGPVVVCALKTEKRAIHSDHPLDSGTSETLLIARQGLAELRNERQVYRSVLTLVSELARRKKSNILAIQRCIHEIAEKASNWPNQWQRERQLRDQGHLPQPKWFFAQDNLRKLELYRYWATRQRSDHPLSVAFGPPSDPIHLGHLVVCELVNAFSPTVYVWGDTPVEAPDTDLTGGIRPVLYHILRREYLRGSGIGICRNTHCRELFEIERDGQEFCGDVCSRHQRQREYWKKRGNKLRKRRLKIHKSA
jgi:hypothetical protein